MHLDKNFIDPIVCFNCNSTTSFRVPVFTSVTIVVVKVDLHVIRMTQNFKVKNKKMVTVFVSDLQRLLKVSLGWKYPAKFILSCTYKIRISYAVSICTWFLKCQFGSLLQTQKKNDFESNFFQIRTWFLLPV